MSLAPERGSCPLVCKQIGQIWQISTNMSNIASIHKKKCKCCILCIYTIFCIFVDLHLAVRACSACQVHAHSFLHYCSSQTFHIHLILSTVKYFKSIAIISRMRVPSSNAFIPSRGNICCTQNFLTFQKALYTG